MSFLTIGALAIGLLVAAPFIAHLLRRGRARELPFAAARLVPAARSVAEQRAQLDDRWLFALRALSILLLALLGATPLVRCSRLSLERATGASVALALVLDDSLSMRATLPNGSTRWDRALRAATELSASARRGDAIAIVLAGRPARVALSPTTDLSAVQQALSGLRVSDRGTDLDGAVQMARSLLRELAQRDRQIAVLSDFAAEPPAAGEPRISAPLPELWQPIDDCGISDAERSGVGVTVNISCSSAKAAEERQVEALDFDPFAKPANNQAVLGRAVLQARGGSQTVVVNTPNGREVLGVRLSGKDALARDDAASVGLDSQSLQVGVQQTAPEGGALSGATNLVEQALRALGEDVAVRPLSVLPDDATTLNRYAALLLDDPSGLGPEVRTALEQWVQRGGVATAFLGERAQNTVLGLTLEPFSQGPLPWEKTSAKGVDVSSIGWLGPEASGLSELHPRGRVRLESALMSGTQVRARWDDGAPFLLQRQVGRGTLLMTALSSSPDDSDFALRPAFLSLLHQVLAIAREQSGQRRGMPGLPFRFPQSERVQVIGPDGAALSGSNDGARENAQLLFTPELVGRYRVRSADGDIERIVAFEPSELRTPPHAPDASSTLPSRNGDAKSLDVSPEMVSAVLALVGLEVLLRLFRVWRRRPLDPGAKSPQSSKIGATSGV
ncbi:MAG: BatA and WFA domain-containing protein [Polyangiaceae bacterium]